MGSLSNLYISQSYQSLLHFGNNSSASATLVEIQDGVGTGLGVYLNATGSISASNTITTNNLIVNNSTELTGVFDLDTYFTASTPAYINSTQPFFTDTVFVTGSYPLGGYPPSIADVQVGWIGNGINVTNGVVTAVSQSVSGYYITMAGQFPQSLQPYTFRGQISPTARITGSLEISENLIVSGTFDIEGKVVVNDNVRINGNLEVSGSQRNTGSLFVSNEISSSTINGIGNVTSFSQSLWAEFTNLENYTSSLRTAFTASGVDTIFSNDITASNIEVRNNLNVVGTLFASKVVTLIESSSIIFSSGSNILGDSILDTQTLNGDVIMSGSASLTGSMGISNNLEVKGNISSSTISGIGNVTSYSQSVDARLDFLEGPFSTSVDARLDELENWSSSLETAFATTAELTQTASVLQSNINQKLFTSSFNAYTQSFSASIAADFVTTNNNITSLSQSVSSSNGLTNARINTLSSFTGSYATTGSNTFNGNQIFSGSVRGRVINLSVTSQTASMDLSLGNFFTLTLPTASVTFLNTTNIQPGETVQLLVTQQSTTGSLNYSSALKFATGSAYSASVFPNSVDILSFATFNTSSIYAVSIKNMV